MGMLPILGTGSTGVSGARRLMAELLLRSCLLYSVASCWLRLEKKLAFDAVMGVLGVLLVARFGGGVTLRLSASADGGGNDEIRLFVGVPSGSKFNGGSRTGCKFFLVECWTAGCRSGSEPDPTVRPLRCRMDPVVLFSPGLPI